MVRSQVKRTKSIFVDMGNVNKLGAPLRYIKLLSFLQKRDLEQLSLTLAYTSTQWRIQKILVGGDLKPKPQKFGCLHQN